MRRFSIGTLAFVLVAALVVSAQGTATAASGFTDVVKGSYYAPAVEWAAEQGITVGISPTQFGPDVPMPRAQVVTMAWRAAGSPTGSPASGFTDVPKGSYYEEAVNWAKATGITTGVSATSFAPLLATTRAMYVTFHWRATGSPTGSPASGFTDVPKGSFYEEAVNWAKATGITTGVSATSFAPNRIITRAEGVTMLWRSPEQLQILSINDFHGNIATTSGAFGGVGRADYLAANMRAAEAEVKNSITVSAGDLIGASPLISALFHDEPTIEAMNLIGLDINGVGNHEFDEGPLEVLRMANGGTHPVDGDFGGDVFEGADFDFLAANVEVTATGDTVLPPYSIRDFGGVDVAFIGMTLEGTPSIVTPSGVLGLTFNDEVATVNALMPELKAMNVEAIVVLMHEGGFASEGGGDGDGCGTLSGNLNDIVTGLDDAVDLVIGGHNNQRFTCMDVDGKAVTMAYHSGRMFTDIDVSLSRQTGDMTVVSLDNTENFQDGVTPAADLTALIDKYDALSAPLGNVVIGSITADITETNKDATVPDPLGTGESALGDVIADAQWSATSGAATGMAVAAFMNPGGIRDDMLFAEISGGEAAGEITYSEAFSVQPFGNSLVTMTLTGTQIDTLLEQQWVGQTSPRILQVSDGLTYEWSDGAAVGSKVDPTKIKIGGVAVVPGDSYRVTVNSFLADGGDNFAVLVDGTDRLGGEIDLDALVTYFGDNTPVAPGPQTRITMVP